MAEGGVTNGSVDYNIRHEIEAKRDLGIGEYVSGLVFSIFTGIRAAFINRSNL